MGVHVGVTTDASCHLRLALTRALVAIGDLAPHACLRSPQVAWAGGERVVRVRRHLTERPGDHNGATSRRPPAAGLAVVSPEAQAAGQALHSEELEHQRLGKPTALAVFASDNLSSSAYATEEILHVLIPVAGAVAFSLVVPITLAMCVVLGFLILSYRETIKVSLGRRRLPGHQGQLRLHGGPGGRRALLVDYILTVAVSASAGTAALTSAFDASRPTASRSRCSSSPSSRGATCGASGSRAGSSPSPRTSSWSRWRSCSASGPGSTWPATCPTTRGREDGQLTLDGVGVSGVGFLLGVKLYDVLHASRPAVPR